MSKPIVNFTAQGNWTEVYNERRTVTYVTDKIIIPIPAFEIGFLFDKHILAIKAFSRSAKPTWKYAGSLYQRLQLGSGGAASNLPEIDLSTRGIPLSRTVLVEFPRYTTEFGLVFVPPTWMLEIELTFWEYNGVHSDNVTDDLKLAREALARIETKLNTPSSS